jgi:hypothetical protein
MWVDDCMGIGLVNKKTLYSTVQKQKLVIYTRYSQRVWTNANLGKDFVKVKTYSDLIVLKQDAHDKLGEPDRWVMYEVDFDESPHPAMDTARAE